MTSPATSLGWDRGKVWPHKACSPTFLPSTHCCWTTRSPQSPSDPSLREFARASQTAKRTPNLALNACRCRHPSPSPSSSWQSDSSSSSIGRPENCNDARSILYKSRDYGTANAPLGPSPRRRVRAMDSQQPLGVAHDRLHSSVVPPSRGLPHGHRTASARVLPPLPTPSEPD